MVTLDRLDLLLDCNEEIVVVPYPGGRKAELRSAINGNLLDSIDVGDVKDVHALRLIALHLGEGRTDTAHRHEPTEPVTTRAL